MQKYIKKLGRTVSSKHFRTSLFVILTLVTVVFLTALGVLYSQFIVASRQNAEAKVNRLALTVQDQLTAARTNARFIGSIKSVEKLQELEELENSELAPVVNELGPFFNQSAYEAVQIFFERSRRIYISGVGMYTFEDYFDQQRLQALLEMPGNELWRVEQYQNYFGDHYPVSVVTYAKATPVYGAVRNGFISVSIPVSQLQTVTAEAMPGGLEGVAVFFDDSYLFSTDTRLTAAYSTGEPYQVNARRVYGSGWRLYVQSTNQTAITIFCSVPVGELLAGYLPTLSLIFLGLCGAAFLSAMLYSSYMLHSVDHIMQKFGGAGVLQEGRHNEFEWLGTAVDDLNGQMRSMRQTVQKNLPLVRERIIHEIICSHVDFSPGSEDYGEYGIVLSAPYFVVMMVSIPELSALGSRATREKIYLAAQSEAEKAFGELGRVYSTYGDNHSLLFLINTEKKANIEERFREPARAFCARMLEGLSVSPLISVGICSSSHPAPYEAYIQARRNLIYTYADQEEFLLFSRQSEYTPVVEESLLGMLTQSVINRNQEELEGAISILKKTAISPEIELRQAQRLCDICACTVFIRLQEMNLDTPEPQLTQCLQRIAAADREADCLKQLHDYLHALLSVGQLLPDKSLGHVRRAAAYIEQYYSKDISVPQIAQHTAVNPIYLNKLFKLATGKTISEYLNFYRVELSRQMLLKDDDTITAISRRVGYNDSRSFIRFFKKFHGTTPNEYRKLVQNSRQPP